MQHDATHVKGATAVQEYPRLSFLEKIPARVLMRTGWLKPAKGGYFCVISIWSRRFLFRSFITSSEFGIAAMKTHTVTACSSRPPPGK